jgi:hypothetical protein
LSVSIAGRYSKLETDRSPFLDRAKECARLTVPLLEHVYAGTTNSKIATNFESIGSRGISNLTAKILAALFPTNTPSFRLSLDDLEMEQGAPEDASLKDQINSALGKVERGFMRTAAEAGDRVSHAETIMHTLVSGNALLYIAKEGPKVYHLGQYVCRRDPRGKTVEMITKESALPETLGPKAREAYETAKMLLPTIGEDGKVPEKNDTPIDIYTRIWRTKSGWTWVQEVAGQKVPDSQGNAPEHACPWIPVRYRSIGGEHYGRSFVEDYTGDLMSAEKLSRAIVEGAAAAAKLLILVNPNGTTRIEDITDSDNGEAVYGNAPDVTTLQMNKAADFRVAENLLTKIEQRLEFAFLMNTAIQRNGDRVTAEEIRYMAGELEDALGGVYTLLAQEYQLPYVNRRLHMMQQAGKMPKINRKLVKPTITTGIEALGRGHDRNRLVGYLTTLAQTIGPEAVMQHVNVGTLIQRLALADGIDTENLMRTPEEIQQEQQQAQLMGMIQQLGPQAIQQAGGLAQQQMKGTADG